MKMTWNGEPSLASEEYKKTFKIVLIIFFCNFAVDSFFACETELPVADDEGRVTMVKNNNCSVFSSTFASMVSSAFAIYTCIVLIKLRMAIREKYSIPGDCWTDVLSVMCCSFCSNVQMAFQTADYDNEESACLTTTGLVGGPDVSAIVV